MKVKREAKIGIFAVTMILAAWAGIRFLSGIDIFSRNVEYYAAYDQINGVQAASPIMMRGVKIGTVTGIAFDPAKSDKVVLQLTIRRTYRIPTDSEAKIVSQSLMGGKAIEVSYGAASTYLEAGDTIRSSRDRDLMDMADSELDFFKQRFSRLTDDLSQTLGNINRLLEENAASLSGTMTHLNSITATSTSCSPPSGRICTKPSADCRSSPGRWARMPAAWTASCAVSMRWPGSSPSRSSPRIWPARSRSSTPCSRSSTSSRGRSASWWAMRRSTIRSRRRAATSRRCSRI